MLMPVKIFCCYAHEDEALLNQLKKHLMPLQRQGVIDIWHDRDISAGTDWEQEIKVQLNTAQIILLLVSPDFMASDYCYSIEMTKAMERHNRGEAVVIPIILRAVYFQKAPFGKLQALPTDAKPVKSKHWNDQDEAFFNVAEGIRLVAEKLKEFVLFHTLTGHRGDVWSVALSTDRQTLVSGSYDQTIKVWNLSTGQELRTLTGHSAAVTSVALSADGQTLVSGSKDKTIKVWRMQ
jgi:TIR domain/WD domain, G-beta repeat